MFLSDIKNISFHKTVLALSKWVDWIVESDFISLFPRVESQDAWLFKTPISEDVIDSSAFYLGTPRCDNRLASIFNTSGYRIFNPIFQLHAIELSSNVRNSGLYEMAGSPLGKTRNVFITIDFPIHQNYSNL